MKKYLPILTKVPLFAGIDEEKIPEMLADMGVQVRKYEKESYVKMCGDPADFIGVVLSGRIQILQDNYDGDRNIIASLSQGSLFAEAFACAGIKNLPVDIMASEPAEILFIGRNALFEHCQTACMSHHAVLGNLLRIIAAKNMYLNQKLQYMTHKTTSEKIMAYLYDQAKVNQASEFVIPFDRQGLADYLGVERSAMSVEIGKLVKSGRIETKRSLFRIRQEE